MWVVRVLSLGVRRIVPVGHQSTCLGETILDPDYILDGITYLIIGPGNGALQVTGTITGMETEGGDDSGQYNYC